MSFLSYNSTTGPVLRTYRSRIPPSQQSQTQTAPRELLSGPSLLSPFMRPVLGGSPIRHNKKGAAGERAPPASSSPPVLGGRGSGGLFWAPPPCEKKKGARGEPPRPRISPALNCYGDWN